jgi:hypothetical protein
MKKRLREKNNLRRKKTLINPKRKLETDPIRPKTHEEDSHEEYWSEVSPEYSPQVLPTWQCQDLPHPRALTLNLESNRGDLNAAKISSKNAAHENPTTAVNPECRVLLILNSQSRINPSQFLKQTKL